jgi:hypothetical protein
MIQPIREPLTVKKCAQIVRHRYDLAFEGTFSDVPSTLVDTERCRDFVEFDGMVEGIEPR